MEIKVQGDGPFKSAFDIDTKNVVRREIVTYRMDNGIMRKEIATRTYYKSEDYNDSISIIPLPTDMEN